MHLTPAVGGLESRNQVGRRFAGQGRSLRIDPRGRFLVTDDGVGLPPPQGLEPLIDGDLRRPHEACFAHVDQVLDRAAALGLYLALLPTWGANVQDADPPRFTPESAGAFGRFPPPGQDEG